MVDSPFKQSGRRGKEKAPMPFTAPTSSIWYSRISLRNALKSSRETVSGIKNLNRAHTLYSESKDWTHTFWLFVLLCRWQIFTEC